MTPRPKLTKQQRRQMAKEALLKKASQNLPRTTIAAGNTMVTRLLTPPPDYYGDPEFGNHTLHIEPGEQMFVIDRGYFRRKLRLKRETCVIMDEFGGDFGVPAYESAGRLLVIPIGHARQDLWPATIRLERTFTVCTDTGSLAFLGTSNVPEAFMGMGQIWACRPGPYAFSYEEVVSLGPFKQAFTRNIVVQHAPYLA